MELYIFCLCVCVDVYEIFVGECCEWVWVFDSGDGWGR